MGRVRFLESAMKPDVDLVGLENTEIYLLRSVSVKTEPPRVRTDGNETKMNSPSDASAYVYVWKMIPPPYRHIITLPSAQFESAAMLQNAILLSSKPSYASAL